LHDKNVEDDLRAEVAPYGIIIESVAPLGDVRFPREVEEAIIFEMQMTASYPHKTCVIIGE